ncbi:MAG: adenylyl-sulfate kinase [Thioalkalispiraceae bacterium]|jgi:adenylylsulfate kinase
MSDQKDELISANAVWHHATITREHHEKLNGHRGVIVWLTGLSGAGKSTLAHAVEEKLYEMNCHTRVLDGDNVRHGLCGDLTFSADDRKENIRRIGEMSKLFLESGIITLTAFISPFKEDRNFVRNLVAHGDFLEVYCNAPLEVCEQRDVKGLYEKARQGIIPNYTGISSPYEAPVNPELIVNTGTEALEKSVTQVIELLVTRNILTV